AGTVDGLRHRYAHDPCYGDVPSRLFVTVAGLQAAGLAGFPCHQKGTRRIARNGTSRDPATSDPSGLPTISPIVGTIGNLIHSRPNAIRSIQSSPLSIYARSFRSAQPPKASGHNRG